MGTVSCDVILEKFNHLIKFDFIFLFLEGVFCNCQFIEEIFAVDLAKITQHLQALHPGAFLRLQVEIDRRIELAQLEVLGFQRLVFFLETGVGDIAHA